MKGFDMSQFEDGDGEMDVINPVEHLESLNDKQKAFLAMAVNNHREYEEVRRKYREELDALNKKYEALEAPIFEERRKIVAGEKSLEEAKVEAEKQAEMAALEGRLPDFWFHTLRNNDMVRQMSGLSDDDKECMSYIRDIVCETLPTTEGEVEVDDCDCGDECCCEGEHKEEDKGEKRKIPVQKRGFKITFHFNEGNPFFPERTLTKTYHLIQHPMEPEPIFDSVESDKPTWSEGKNLTVKKVKKVMKGKKGKKAGPKKTVTVEEPCESFFNFFNAPEVPKDMSTMSPEEAEMLQQGLEMDVEVGRALTEDIIPRAVLWYTGMARDNDDDDYDDEDEFDDEGDDDDEDDEDVDEEEDEDDEDDDEDEAADGAAKPQQETPEECKQQ